MIRRVAVLAAIASVVAAAALSASAATPAGQLKITETAGSKFPAKQYVLTLPRQVPLTPQQITVLENGQPANNLSIDLPGASVTSSFGVVLLIDASNSMSGDPIRQAMAAARTFAAHRSEGEQLSVVLFNNSTRVLLPFTRDGTAIGKALATVPRLAYGTHIYDAVGSAEKLLSDSQIAVGSIVLLSDGRDVGSRTTQETLLTQLRTARARLFSVGLRSAQFDPTTLTTLASTTGGTFSLASSAAELTAIYSSLGNIISNEYVVRYRSLAGAGQRAYVAVTVSGFSGVASASYTAPALLGGVNVQRTLSDRIIQSPLTAAAVILLFVLLIGLAVYLLVRRRDRRFERRLGQFVSLPLEERAQLRRANITAELAEKEQRSQRELGWFARLESDVDIGRISAKPATIVAATIAASFVLAVVAAALTGSVWGLVLGLLAPLAARIAVKRRVSWVRRQFAEQLPDNLDVISSAIRAGHSLVGALAVMVDGAGQPSQAEFGRVVADEQLGVPLDQALRLTALRMVNRDLLQVSLVARLQRDAGTNVAEVLEQVATNVRNQMELRRLVRTLTAQGRMARWIVSALPIFLFGALFVLNKHYLSPLWSTTGGKAALIIASVMIISGSLVIKKIVEIEV